jgi:small subunit ribosomal protein S18
MAEHIEEKEEGSKTETTETKQTVSGEESVEKAPGAQRPAGRPERTEFRDTAGRERPERKGRRGGAYYEAANGKDKESGHDQSARIPRFKRKLCSFCQDKNLLIDYKRPDILERFITDRGKILPRRVTGTCSKHQRFVAREIKRARIIALLPFVEQ